MRNAFLALVLANLGFAAWHAWFSGAASLVRPPRDEAPSITLTSEVPEDLAGLHGPAGQSEPEAAPEPPADKTPAAGPATPETPSSPTEAVAVPDSSAAAPAPAADGNAAAAARCVSVGPFRELAQAATAAANLRMAGYEPTQRVAEGEIWIGYWVYIQGIPTEAEANDVLAKVRAKGLTDSYVIPNSDSGNLVSLGVFSEISGVSRRREEVRALGYEPTVVDRTRRGTVYWVDVTLKGDQTLDFETLQTPGRIVRLEQRKCASAPQ
jgi:SPOR domain